jgi:large subunit ribosomal protein L17
MVFSYLQNKEAVTELFREVAVKVGDRPGGYTRIIKTGNRLGDNAEMCMIELVDFNDIYGNEKKEAKKSTRRSKKATVAAEAPAAAPAEVVAEEAADSADAAPAETNENEAE